MSDDPRPLGDELHEVLLRIDPGTLARYQSLKRETERQKKETRARYRSHIQKLLRLKHPPLERIQELEEKRERAITEMEEELQDRVRQLVQELLP